MIDSMESWDEPCQCGISSIMLLSTKDPFTWACKWHDYEYEKLKRGYGDKTLKQVDDEFLRRMLIMCSEYKGVMAWYYRRRAYAFYYVARAWAKILRRKLKPMSLHQ